MERTSTSSLVPFQPFQPGRNKLRHALSVLRVIFGKCCTIATTVRKIYERTVFVGPHLHYIYSYELGGRSYVLSTLGSGFDQIFRFCTLLQGSLGLGLAYTERIFLKSRVDHEKVRLAVFAPRKAVPLLWSFCSP